MFILKEIKCYIQNEDFSFVRLKNTNFDYISFQNCDFEGSKMDNVNIQKCWFMSCNLKNVLWQNMKIQIQLDMRNEVYSYTFSDDNKFIAANVRNKVLELWHLKAAKMISCIIDERFYYNGSIDFAYNNILVTYCQLSNTIKFKNCQSCKSIRTVKANCPIKISHSFEFMAFASESTIYLWDNKECKKLLEFNSISKIDLLQFSSDDKFIATCAKDGKICIWNILNNQQELYQIPNFSQYGFYVRQLSPNFKYIACSNWGCIQIYEIATGINFSTPNQCQAMNFSQNSNFFAIANYYGVVQLFALNEQKSDWNNTIGKTDQWTHIWEESEYFRKDDILSLSFLDNERNLISINKFGQIKFHDGVKESRKYKSSYSSAVFSPIGKILAIGDAKQEIISIWDMQQGKQLYDLVPTQFDSGENSINNITFSFDGQFLAYSFNKKIKLWDIKQKQLISVYNYEHRLVQIVLFHPTNLELYCIENSTILGWKVKMGKLVLKLKVKSKYGSVNALAYSLQNNLLAAGYYTKTILMDSRSGVKQKILNTPNSTHQIAFSPNGKILASSSFSYIKVEQRSIILWDVVSGNQIQIIPVQWYISCLKFLPNEQLLAYVVYDTIWVWRISESSVSQDPLALEKATASSIDFSQDGTMLATVNQSVSVWQLEKIRSYSDQDQDQLKSDFCKNQILKKTHKLTLLYSFKTDFNLNLYNSCFTNSQIISNHGVNLIQRFLQFGGHH